MFEQNLKLPDGKGTALIEAFPGKYPVVISNCGKDLPLVKRKFLVHKDTTFGQLAYVIRKHSKLPPHKAMFIYVDNTLPSSSSLVSTLFEKSHEENCLYINVNSENTFGDSCYQNSEKTFGV